MFNRVGINTLIDHDKAKQAKFKILLFASYFLVCSYTEIDQHLHYWTGHPNQSQIDTKVKMLQIIRRLWLFILFVICLRHLCNHTMLQLLELEARRTELETKDQNRIKAIKFEASRFSWTSREGSFKSETLCHDKPIYTQRTSTEFEMQIITRIIFSLDWRIKL